MFQSNLLIYIELSPVKQNSQQNSSSWNFNLLLAKISYETCTCQIFFVPLHPISITAAILKIVHFRLKAGMSVSTDYYDQYMKLAAKDRKWVLRTLMYWGGWTKTSVYRKLHSHSRSRIEEVLVAGVFRSIKRHQDGQLKIDFDWTEDAGLILLPSKAK